jgi:molecular chaperone DnaK
MSRLTVDYGIDLGTTNSSIAVFEKNGPRIIRNNENWQFTPSAVWADRNGALRVGRAAKERVFSDPENGAAEFKLMMGRAYSKPFARLNRSLTPEELSAEVLKSLKEDLRRETGEDLQEAVITVPAAFDQPESEATRRAAKLAGISFSPLLQEPIAASLAYGFQHEQDNVFWLVFDFGGGTFDAAVIHVRDCVVQVVNHGGDNNLGGKLIDWAIVEQIFVPALRSFNLPDFRRGNKKWLVPLAKLKLHAESAKIALSKDLSYEITDEIICQDDSGEPVHLDLAITRSQLERLIDPLLSKTVNICKDILAAQKLSPRDISKVILVGGPTVTPIFREVLLDRERGLGIPIDFSVDPLTVVAQGAALFAGAQRMPQSAQASPAGEFSLSLEYKPIGNDIEPLVAGKVSGIRTASFDGFAIRIQNPDARPPWDSGKLPLNAEGKFLANLRAERGGKNTFHVQLYDSKGREVVLRPCDFPYTVGLVITDPPLPHDVGIAMANDEMDVLFKKGTPLPAKAKTSHRTTIPLRKGDSQSVVRIPFVEGNNADHASLNRKIGEVAINAETFKYDLPVGSEIELRLEIDSSRHMTGTALVEVFDKAFPISIDGLVKRLRPLQELGEEFAVQQQRLRAAKGSPAAEAVAGDLDKLTKEDVVTEVSRLLAAGDPADAGLCEDRILNLKTALQRIEDVIELPKLIAEGELETKWAEELMPGATADEQKNFALLRPELEAAGHGEIATLRRKVEEMSQLRLRIATRTPQFWVTTRDYLLEHKSDMFDQTQAKLWFSHADRAIKGNDLEALTAACRQLWALMPEEQQTRGYGGGTVRARGIR